MSFDNLAMTSVSLPSGLKAPPPLASARFIDTNSNCEKVGGSSSLSHGSPNLHHPHQSTEPVHLLPRSSRGATTHNNKSATMPSPRKSVEFVLHPPPSKRTKLDSSWSAKQVVDAISTSIAPHERLEAIQKTKEAFDHDSQQAHDEEIAAGADSVLAKHLAFVLTSSKSDLEAHNDDDAHEMTMTELSLCLECLELLYRASSAIVGASFRRMGPVLLDLLKTIVTDEIARRTKRVAHGSDADTAGITAVQDDASAETSLECRVGTPEGDIILKKAIRIFGHFARVGEATKPMAHFPGFVQGLVHIVALQPYDNLPWEARLSALWCIANLACNGDNMDMMARVPGLIAALISISHRALPHEANIEHTMEVLRARSIASRALLNLSWSTSNKSQMAANADLLDVLTDLILRRNVPNAPLMKSRTVRDIVATTRRHAIGAIRNLAAASRTVKVTLCDYKNGHILDVLTEAALNDPDQATVDRAFAAIHNLANHDTATRIVSHPALVMALKDVLMSSDPSDLEAGTPKSHASATLMVLERSIRRDMPEYENLRGLLEAMSPENNSSNDMGSEMDSIEPTEV